MAQVVEAALGGEGGAGEHNGLLLREEALFQQLGHAQGGAGEADAFAGALLG